MISRAEFQRMGRRAWSNAEHMQVLADLALESGLDLARLHEEFRPTRRLEEITADDEAYAIECFVRKAILRSINPRLELRVTGGWPDILFVVCRTCRLPRLGSDVMGKLHLHFMGKLRQPRLLEPALSLQNCKLPRYSTSWNRCGKLAKKRRARASSRCAYRRKETLACASSIDCSPASPGEST